jgi:hypothetical protein
MMTVLVAAVQVAIERLAALANDLAECGFVTQVKQTDSGLRLHVVNRTVRQLSEDVWAGPAADGSWWFWWSWGEPITGIDEVDAAAVKIAHVLTPSHD